jgi:hypothetical protein
MAKVTIDNGDTGLEVRTAINGMFTELYAGQKVAVPATPASTGVAGTWALDASNIYLCTATNVWVRAPLTFDTWTP